MAKIGEDIKEDNNLKKKPVFLYKFPTILLLLFDYFQDITIVNFL
jgi:hypothetical protein